MNEKYMLYILIVVMVVTNSNYAFATPITSKANDIVPRGDNKIPPVGLLDVKYSDHTSKCTATIIDSNSGNVGLTAAHCLFDYVKNVPPTEVYFHPGYNRGDSKFGKIPVPIKNIVVLKDVEINNPVDDYGMFKVDFGGKKLRSVTGSFAVDLNPPVTVGKTTVFGYPKGGQMPSCPKDGNTFCGYLGSSVKNPAYRGIPIDVGGGASGGPWINNGNGKIIGVSSTYIQNDGKMAAAVWTTDGFNNMLKQVDNK